MLNSTNNLAERRKLASDLKTDIASDVKILMMPRQRMQPAHRDIKSSGQQ